MQANDRRGFRPRVPPGVLQHMPDVQLNLCYYDIWISARSIAILTTSLLLPTAGGIMKLQLLALYPRPI